MKKKIVAILLMGVITVQLTGCGVLSPFIHFLNSIDTSEGELRLEMVEEENEAQRAADKVRYQDDFYEYVNNDILDMVELGDTDAQWTWFGELMAVADHDMDEIIQELSQSEKIYPKGTSEQKIKDLYECISNMENRNATGLGPLQPHMDTIRNATTIDEYVNALASLSGEFGFSSIVGGYYIDQDMADSSMNSVYLMYADTLIGKEYLENPQMQEYVDVYYDYMRDMLEEFGMSQDEAADTVSEIDVLLRDICSCSLSMEEYYDPSITYNVFNKEELQALYTNVDVEKMLKTLRVDSAESYIVSDVSQAKRINELLVEENLEVLKDFSTFVMLNDVAEYSTQEYAKLADDLDRQLHGVTSSLNEEDIWMNLTQDMLSWDFGKIYVEKYFSEESKADVEAMIDKIKEAYKDIIRNQEWMSEETKEKAIRKLDTMQVKIGYPDKWPDSMEMMQVTPISEGGSLLSNLLVNMQVSIEDNLQDLNREVDRTTWSMTPQTVNAYYNPGNNEIVFPAAILQPPFYDPEGDEASNLGGIGYVIAHEISHAFDSNGALYDEYGNYNVWWTQEELQRYKELSQSIVDYYENYEVAGMKVDGSLTLSENIADLGAMTCITSILEDDGEGVAEAFSQLAYIWASEETVAYQMYLLSNDTHAPNKVRVNAVLSSCDAFYETYDIEEGDGMYVAPEDRVGIWK
ncbi:MAG: M13 family metallopeptidase [Lachnospiraceae bacterium]|nr:M13 family metallopeptidase [Lachnospiraceae bacterium]